MPVSDFSQLSEWLDGRRRRLTRRRAASGAAGGPGTAGLYLAEQQATGRQAPQPTLYLHGATDGCIRVELARGAERLLAPSSRMVVIENAGHFLQLEKPAEVNEHILTWIGR